MEGGRSGSGLDSVPETVPASSAARAHVDGAEREDEAPGTAGAGPGRLHGAGAELAVRQRDSQAWLSLGGFLGHKEPAEGKRALGALSWFFMA